MNTNTSVDQTQTTVRNTGISLFAEYGRQPVTAPTAKQIPGLKTWVESLSKSPAKNPATLLSRTYGEVMLSLVSPNPVDVTTTWKRLIAVAAVGLCAAEKRPEFDLAFLDGNKPAEPKTDSKSEQLIKDLTSRAERAEDSFTKANKELKNTSAFLEAETNRRIKILGELQVMTGCFQTLEEKFNNASEAWAKSITEKDNEMRLRIDEAINDRNVAHARIAELEKINQDFQDGTEKLHTELQTVTTDLADARKQNLELEIKLHELQSKSPVAELPGFDQIREMMTTQTAKIRESITDAQKWRLARAESMERFVKALEADPVFKEYATKSPVMLSALEALLYHTMDSIS